MVAKRYRGALRNKKSSKRSKLRDPIQSHEGEWKSRERKDDGISFETSKKVICCTNPRFDIDNRCIRCGYVKSKEEEHRDKLKTIEEDRKKTYGDPFLSHQAIGLVWEGIFRNRYHCFSSYSEHMTTIGGALPEQNKYYSPSMMPGQLFPADLVAEFLAGFKICRLARPQFLQDSADDAKVYISFSERFRKGK